MKTVVKVLHTKEKAKKRFECLDDEVSSPEKHRQQYERTTEKETIEEEEIKADEEMSDKNIHRERMVNLLSLVYLFGPKFETYDSKRPKNDAVWLDFALDHFKEMQKEKEKIEKYFEAETILKAQQNDCPEIIDILEAYEKKRSLWKTGTEETINQINEVLATISRLEFKLNSLHKGDDFAENEDDMKKQRDELVFDAEQLFYQADVLRNNFHYYLIMMYYKIPEVKDKSTRSREWIHIKTNSLEYTVDILKNLLLVEMQKMLKTQENVIKRIPGTMPEVQELNESLDELQKDLGFKFRHEYCLDDETEAVNQIRIKVSQLRGNSSLRFMSELEEQIDREMTKMKVTRTNMIKDFWRLMQLNVDTASFQLSLPLDEKEFVNIATHLVKYLYLDARIDDSIRVCGSNSKV